VGAQSDEPARPDPATESADELRYNELVLLLEEEIVNIEEEFEYEENLNEERAAIERDACLAPSGEEWRMLLRREEALDRAIDRKVKLLLSLRKATGRLEQPRTLGSRSEPAAANDVGAPLVDAEADQEDSHEGRPYGVNPEPSPEGSGCQAPAVSSPGA
jgi:hypothetical protein